MRDLAEVFQGMSRRKQAAIRALVSASMQGWDGEEFLEETVAGAKWTGRESTANFMSSVGAVAAKKYCQEAPPAPPAARAPSERKDTRMNMPAARKMPAQATRRDGPLATTMGKICGMAGSKKRAKKVIRKTDTASSAVAEAKKADSKKAKAAAALERKAARDRAAARKAAATKKKVVAEEARKA